MTNQEAQQERDRVRNESIEKDKSERAMDSKQRADDINQRNSEKKQQREQTENILRSSSTSINEVIQIGGAIGKRLEREIRRAEQTGRVSNWLAGETIKAEAAKNAAQQSAFNRAVIDVVSTLQPSIQIGQQSSYRPSISEKPTVKDTTSVGTASAPKPWDLIAKIDPDADPEDPSPPYIVTVTAGTLNGILPSNYDYEFSCSNNGFYYAIAKIQTDGYFINGLTIDITTTPPVQQTAELFGLSSNIDYLFGLFSGGLIYNIAQGNIVLNTDLVMVQTVSPIPAVGESLYNLYYRLQ